MTTESIVTRQALQLRPDATRVVVRPFKPAIEPRDANPADLTRVNNVVAHVLALGAGDAAAQLTDVLDSFDDRHRDLLGILEARADEMDGALAMHAAFSPVQRQLVGAYFLQENSFEAAALFNPSIVLHPDQAGTAPGAVRVIISLRAVGEGHISSLTFRTGTISSDGEIEVDQCVRLASVPAIRSRRAGPDSDGIDLIFNADEDISERVIFPVTAAQANGIEDARFVRFDDEGRAIYYATYTAYNGRAIASELIETADFVSFRMAPLRGAASHNKGMALFPRKIGGRYAMIARQDNENLYLLYSDDLHTWETGVRLLAPQFPWEFVQIGNCGSPIELEEGWLLLTHGVGPVRKYSIGAVLLDARDPSKVIGRVREPLIGPEASERGGYVPNVVYTCGALRHGRRLILPYAVSDTFVRFATIDLAALLRAMHSD